MHSASLLCQERKAKLGVRNERRSGRHCRNCSASYVRPPVVHLRASRAAAMPSNFKTEQGREKDVQASL